MRLFNNLFPRPVAAAPPSRTPEEEIAAAEKLLAQPANKRLRATLLARIEQARARIRVREALAAEL